MKVLRILGIIILAIVVVIALVAAVIWGIRAYNARHYPLMASSMQTTGFETNESITRIEGDYLAGYHFHPRERRHAGAIVVYGGSEGSPAYDQAKELSEEGYEVLGLYFFGQPNQQATLANVPLEHFTEVKDYIATNIDDPSPLTVIGTSKGAELTAVLAAHGYPIDNLVNFAPAGYSYPGLDFGSQVENPSFTDQGEPVPFASFRVGKASTGLSLMRDVVLNIPPAYRPTYEQAAAHAAADAAIDLRGFGGNALFFAGDADAMWQSEVAAKDLAGQSDRFEAHVYPDAGHLFSSDIEALGNGWQRMFGGTAEGSARAAAESQQVLLEHLAQWHGTMPEGR